MIYKILKHKVLKDTYGTLYRDEICVVNIPELFIYNFFNDDFKKYYEGKKALQDLKDYYIVTVSLKQI